jgi:hypothetical protein
MGLQNADGSDVVSVWSGSYGGLTGRGAANSLRAPIPMLAIHTLRRGYV